MCQSVIFSVLSHEEIYLNICRNVRGLLTFMIHYIYIYIYIYIYVCVCVCVCVCARAAFLNAYFIEQYGHVLSTYFCILSFQLPNWFYSIRRELVDETFMTICYPSSVCSILGHHQGCVYCKSNVTFTCILLLCKCLLFMLVCYCSFIVLSISSSSIWRHLSTLSTSFLYKRWYPFL